MPRALRPSLSQRTGLSPTAVFIAAAAILVLGVLAGLYEEELYRTQKIEETAVQASILADSVAAPLVFGDADAARKYVAALAENPEVAAAAVYDNTGARVAGFVRMGADPLPATVTARSAYLSGGLVYAALSVIQNGTTIGTVYVRETTDSLQRRLVRYGGIILLATMGVLVMAVVGIAHIALSRANAKLEAQARELRKTNATLQSEMRERERAEDVLRQTQKMDAIGQLSGGIAHDFNNLITIVKGNLQLMRRRISQGQTDVERYVTAAVDALDRASALTRRILAFSRRQPLSPKPVNLSHLVAGMGDLLLHSVGHGIAIETGLHADWWTLCDTNQMENVILNLAINARDAMSSGGRLMIETENVGLPARVDEIIPGDYVELRIRDNGTGMTEEVRERAIEPFFTTKPMGRGTGLGLSVTFGYIRQSNGYMIIDSVVGEGTSVRILMPRFNVESLSASA